MELIRLEGEDHVVYRCRDCGYLFSPPDVERLPPAVAPSVSMQGDEAAQQQIERVAAVRPRRRHRRGGSEG